MAVPPVTKNLKPQCSGAVALSDLALRLCCPCRVRARIAPSATAPHHDRAALLDRVVLAIPIDAFSGVGDDGTPGSLTRLDPLRAPGKQGLYPRMGQNRCTDHHSLLHPRHLT